MNRTLLLSLIARLIKHHDLDPNFLNQRVKQLFGKISYQQLSLDELESLHLNLLKISTSVAPR